MVDRAAWPRLIDGSARPSTTGVCLTLVARRDGPDRRHPPIPRTLAFGGAIAVHGAVIAIVMAALPSADPVTPSAAGFSVELVMEFADVGAEASPAAGSDAPVLPPAEDVASVAAESLATIAPEADVIEPTLPELDDTTPVDANEPPVEAVDPVEAIEATGVTEAVDMIEAAPSPVAETPVEIEMTMSIEPETVELVDAAEFVVAQRAEPSDAIVLREVPQPTPPKPQRRKRPDAPVAKAAPIQRADVAKPAEPASKPQGQGSAKDPAASPSAAPTPAPPAVTTVASASPQAAAFARPSLSGGQTVPDANALERYMALLQAWLERHKDYPRRAQMRHQEGTVLLFIALDAEGRLLDYRVDRSAGHALLDEAAAAMIERAQPFPKAPGHLNRARLELIVPVSFSLR